MNAGERTRGANAIAAAQRAGARLVFHSVLHPQLEALPHHWAQHFVEQRSEEHTSELQSLMRISYAVFCLKKKNITTITIHYTTYHNHQYILRPPLHLSQYATHITNKPQHQKTQTHPTI